ncbi:NADH-quinone oxidoreductase subunit C [Flavivirga spongiicola]|uniref:NADH-quinone oxidoreductase subunit C n=1 Tax=Flavivirga spongiicola TaxID=421621 RepID=A0ABU7XRJ7_9FLAO|nr:NADH-quinone oxidoreductase subunit C [Flavivirga sp. MEBiC05379]MDO5978412.1 NADH-quinone oxidoreductase subunit C [Flavivirga sp. MEBiC05379]
MMTNEALQHLIGGWFPNPEADSVSDVKQHAETDEVLDENREPSKPINPSLLEFTEEGSQFLNITVQPEQFYALMAKLKTNEETHFDYLFCLSGVDWGEELGVVYHLESTVHRHTIVVKVKTEDRENPNFDSVYNIWATAEFHEREVFDFFGIKFNNHPNLKRLFLTENWEGFPLRKDYVDEINMVIK